MYKLKKIVEFFTRYWAVLIITASIILPPSLIEHSPTICMFRLATGYKCPGCGMTHAFVYFFHGDFYRAIHENISIIIVLPLILFYSIKQMKQFLLSRRILKSNQIEF